jgi:predicted membrane-bound mannosyltransferase
MTSAGDGQGNGTLHDACKEGRHTVDQQIEKIHREDRKAVMLFRSNLIFLSIVASGVAFVVQAEQVSPLQFGNAHMALGATSIFLSTLIAAMTYTSSNFRMGVKPGAITQAHNKTRNEYLTKLSKEYQAWVQKNHKVHRINAYTINAALVFALGSMLFFFGGVVVGGLAIKGSFVSYGLLGFEFLSVAAVSGLVFKSSDLLYFFMDG